MSDKFKQVTSVNLILYRDNKILLIRRSNTGYKDGNYSVVAGHVDESETIKNAMLREAFEEVGIRIKPDMLQLVHIMHRKYKKEIIDFYFVASSWEGELKNMEPHKCDDIKWFHVKNLPNNIILHIKISIQNFLDDVLYSEFGWDYGIKEGALYDECN